MPVINEYRGNTIAELDVAIEKGKTQFVLSRGQMIQLVELQALVTEAKNVVVRENWALTEEVKRLKRGDFTPEEFQALCHHRDERPGCTRAEFAAGCEEYQRKLFGA